jgi:hypothetical protein
MTAQSIVPIGPLWGEDEKARDNFILGVVVFLVFAYIMASWASWQKAHDRKARLAAYGRRTRWRKADVPRLVELGIPRHRIERIIDGNKQRGRGVVPRYQSLDAMMMEMAEKFGVLLAPQTPPHLRRATLKQTPLWPEVVEALYRGEYAAAKEDGMRAPSTHAEGLVAKCLGISDSSVRKTCGTVRKTRKLEGKTSDPGSLLRVSEFEAWTQDGNLQAI